MRGKKILDVRSGIRTHAHRSGLRPERSALDRSAILTLLSRIVCHFPEKTDTCILQKILVTVRDVNDNPPVFEESLVKISIPEGLYPPFDITKVIISSLLCISFKRITK